MALRLEDKKALVAEVKTVAESAHSAVAAEYRGLTVGQMTALRKEAREKGVYLRVVKNTLARLALEGTDFECMKDGLKGPLVLAFSVEDPGSAARVVKAAVRNLDRDRAHLEDIISEAILYESGHLNRFGAIILVIAGVAPLLGLLGTVTGMITTFDIITEFGTGDPKLLSGGISIALVTTELGLAVAIPMLLLGNILSGWAESIKDGMEKGALRVINNYSEHLRTAA